MNQIAYHKVCQLQWNCINFNRIYIYNDIIRVVTSMSGPDLFSTTYIAFKKLKKFCDLFSCLLCAYIKMFTFPVTLVYLTFQNGHCVLIVVKLAKRKQIYHFILHVCLPNCINKLSAKVFVIYSGVQLNSENHKLLRGLHINIRT